MDKTCELVTNYCALCSVKEAYTVGLGRIEVTWKSGCLPDAGIGEPTQES